MREVRGLLGQLLELVAQDMRRGVYDADLSVRNVGIVDGRLIHMDVGTLVPHQGGWQSGKLASQAIWRVRHWLRRHGQAELAADLDQQLSSSLPNQLYEPLPVGRFSGVDEAEQRLTKPATSVRGALYPSYEEPDSADARRRQPVRRPTSKLGSMNTAFRRVVLLTLLCCRGKTVSAERSTSCGLYSRSSISRGNSWMTSSGSARTRLVQHRVRWPLFCARNSLF